MYLFLIPGCIILLFILLPLGAARLFNSISLSRKAKRLLLGALALFLLCFALRLLYINRSIGVYGIKITMNDGTVYKEYTDDPFTIRDRGRKLGRLTDTYGNHWSVFAVRGDPSREYIYVSSMGRGEFYKRSPQ
ncbi:MAG: hypothetical protein IKN89_02960 [Oscillospiraceae bacterium]|nr:hypothetical protein [Oscillospiraceae bacterium]